MKKIIIVFLSFVLISSCSDKEDLIGKWDDNIKLSTKNVDFGVKADSALISTEGDWWMIDEVIFNDISYEYNGNEKIDFESYPYAIIGDDFVVERRDKNTLLIKQDENSTGKAREMLIVLQAGDYFDQVKIVQSAK